MDTETILERRRLRRRASFWRVAAFVLLALLFVAIAGVSTKYRTFDLASVGGQVADIRVDGFIETRPDAVDVIKDAAEDNTVKAILLHIDSPGGAASGGEA